MDKQSCKTCGIKFASAVLYQKHLKSELHMMNKAKLAKKPSSKLASSKIQKSPKQKSILRDETFKSMKTTTRLDDSMNSEITNEMQSTMNTMNTTIHENVSTSQLAMIIKKLDALADQILDLNARMDLVEDNQQKLITNSKAKDEAAKVLQEDRELQSNQNEIKQIEMAEDLIKRKLDAIRKSVAEDLLRTKAQQPVGPGAVTGISTYGMQQSDMYNTQGQRNSRVCNMCGSQVE